MVTPVAFDANVAHFVTFLDQGKTIYQSAK
jgi:hypothetical protein